MKKNPLNTTDTSTCNQVTDVTPTLFVCKTCGAGPFGIDAEGTEGVKIRDFHEKQGHKIKQFVEPS